MILFKKEHVPLILSGRKTQTRRLWKRQRAKVGSIHLAKLKMLSKEYFARIRILKVWQERLSHLSTEDALKEGYPSRAHFLAKFWEINGITSSQIWLWVVEFELLKEGSG